MVLSRKRVPVPTFPSLLVGMMPTHEQQRFEHKHDGKPEPRTESKSDTLQRVEIITGRVERWRFTRHAEARIVLEGRARFSAMTSACLWSRTSARRVA